MYDEKSRQRLNYFSQSGAGASHRNLECPHGDREDNESIVGIDLKENRPT
jgi:hypothetical protein